MADLFAGGSSAGVADAGAGAVAPPAGTGAGSGNQGGDQGSGDKGTGDQGAKAPSSIKFSMDDGEDPVELSLTDDEGEGSADKGDTGFKFEQLDAIKDSNPDLYKTLKGELSKSGRFTKVTGFKTPEEAKVHHDRLQKIDALIGQRQDGKTGLDSIEATLGDLASQLSKVRSGDPELIGRWFKDDPVSSGQMAAAVLDHWKNTDANAYTAAVVKPVWSALAEKDAYGQSAVDALNLMYTATADNPDAQKLLERVAYTLNKLSKAAEYKPDQAPLIAQREAALKKQEADLWNKQTDMEALPIVRTALRKGLTALTSELKKELSAEDRAEYGTFLEKKFFEYAGKDSDFVNRVSALRKNNDRQGILDAVKQARGKYAKQALKDLLRSKLLDRNAIRDEAAGKGEAGSGGGAGSKGVTLQYTGRMKAGAPDVQYDYARMKGENEYMLENREFYIVGKKEKYRW